MNKISTIQATALSDWPAQTVINLSVARVSVNSAVLMDVNTAGLAAAANREVWQCPTVGICPENQQ